MSFYGTGSSFSSSFSSPGAGGWGSPQAISTPPSSFRAGSHDMLALKQKLDEMATIMTSQKELIEKGE